MLGKAGAACELRRMQAAPRSSEVVPEAGKLGRLQRWWDSIQRWQFGRADTPSSAECHPVPQTPPSPATRLYKQCLVRGAVLPVRRVHIVALSAADVLHANIQYYLLVAASLSTAGPALSVLSWKLSCALCTPASTAALTSSRLALYGDRGVWLPRYAVLNRLWLCCLRYPAANPDLDSGPVPTRGAPFPPARLRQTRR